MVTDKQVRKMLRLLAGGKTLAVAAGSGVGRGELLRLRLAGGADATEMNSVRLIGQFDRPELVRGALGELKVSTAHG